MLKSNIVYFPMKTGQYDMYNITETCKVYLWTLKEMKKKEIPEGESMHGV